MDIKPVKGFRISPVVSDRFKKTCKEECRPASTVVEELIVSWLARDEIRMGTNANEISDNKRRLL